MKPVNKPRSLGKILGSTEQLRGLIDQARQNTELLLRVRASMPEALRAHCHAAHIQDQQLVLFTDSPAWVMRLRFSSPQILSGMRATLPNLRGIRVRVQLAERKLQARKRHVVLSNEARRHLKEAAAGIDNSELAAALERLSRAG